MMTHVQPGWLSFLLMTISGNMVILCSIWARQEEHGRNRENKQAEKELCSHLIGIYHPCQSPLKTIEAERSYEKIR